MRPARLLEVLRHTSQRYSPVEPSGPSSSVSIVSSTCRWCARERMLIACSLPERIMRKTGKPRTAPEFPRIDLLETVW
jgi:hypothetical protein